jgi:hypothetical protein
MSDTEKGLREKRPMLNWEADRIFTVWETLSDAALHNGLAIRVNRATSDVGKPLFSIEFGRINRECAFIRFLQPSVSKGPNYQAVVTTPNVEEYVTLMREVGSHIQEAIQRAFDRELDQRHEREEAHVASGKPKQQPGLKTLSKRDRAVRS